MEVKISAQDVNKLRKQTGAGMMDCKKALVEANGDIEAAIEYLRKKGQKLSAKRADRETTEGAVIALSSADGTKGISIKLGCETDFVAKNEDFVNFATSIAELALEKFPASLAELLALDFGGQSLQDKITEQVGKVGEKLDLSSYETLEAPQVVSYIHAGNKLGVLLGLTKSSPDFVDAGKSVAMQVAAMNPLAVDKEGVDPSIVEKEIEIGKDIARNEGKPEAIIEKIALGKLNKFFSENTLLNQKYVKDSKLTVSKFLQTLDKELSISDFKRVALG